MTALLDQLHLEVLASTSGNAISNHSTQDGTLTGWAKFSESFAGATVTADTGLGWGYNGYAFKLTLGNTWVTYQGRRDYGGVEMRSDPIPVVGLQWVNFAATGRAPAGKQRGVQVSIDFFSSTGALLSTVSQYFGDFGGWAADQDNVFSFDSTFGGTIAPKGPQQAPSGSTTMRVRVQASHTFSEPNAQDFAPTWVSKIMVITATSKSLASGPVFSDTAETWQNVLPKALSARVVRGGDVDGVTDQLDAGLLTATVRDPLITPDTNDRVRPGRPIRLMALNGATWEPIFRGKIVTAYTSYSDDVPVVTITATDASADLENYPQPIGKSGRFKQRIDAALLNVPIAYTVADTAADVAQATISGDESGTAGSQLRVIRDSLRGLFYMSRFNVLKCFANNSYPSQAATVTFSDNKADAGAIYYTGIDTNFDSKNMVNTLTVTKSALSEPGGQKVYGPYVNQASVDAWGSVSANITINDGDPATIAAAYLAVYANPSIFTESVTFNASADVTKAITRELYEAARVKFAKANVNAVYRVISIEHTITAGVRNGADNSKWLVELGFKPLEATTSIVVTNPPGGPNTGPKDLLPFTREIQADRANCTLNASSLSAPKPVQFAKPYESPPRVVATTQHASYFASAQLVTTTGFTLSVRLYTGTNTATIPVDWVAIPQ